MLTDDDIEALHKKMCDANAVSKMDTNELYIYVVELLDHISEQNIERIKAEMMLTKQLIGVRKELVDEIGGKHLIIPQPVRILN